MEQRFSHDFSRVRIHSHTAAEQSAREVNAHAYTVGHNIVFASGQFAPGMHEGRRLIAHELAHVVQQSYSLGGMTMMQRAISRELNQIEDLLSYGIFDWAITDADAVEALEILQKLPKYQQAVFISDVKYLNRLRDDFPEERLPQLSDIERGVSDIRPPSAEIEDVREKLSYGLFDWVVTDEEAIEALEKLKKLPDPQLTVALGSINYGRLLDNLPDDRKQELIDLVAKHLAPGGTRTAEEEANPGAILAGISFTSDHGLRVRTMHQIGRRTRSPLW